MKRERRQPTKAELRAITVTFGAEDFEYAVCYQHTDEPASPGTKSRTTTAARMARKGLELALEGLDSGEALWGGFSTDTRQSEDRIIAPKRREQVA